MRLDKFLKVSRLIKRRTVANEACDNARVTVNGRPAKASCDVKPGDVLRIGLRPADACRGGAGRGRRRAQGRRGRHVPRAAGIILPALDKRQNFCYHCILFRLSNDKESDRPEKLSTGCPPLWRRRFPPPDMTRPAAA